MLRASLTALPASDTRQDELHQDAVKALLVYDTAYLHARRVLTGCSYKYTSAILFRERFHAFDGFRDALVTLVRCTTDALERIRAWKKYSASLHLRTHIFVWNGSNFAVTVRSRTRLCHMVKQRLGV